MANEERVVCVHCGAVNRVPAGSNADAAKCGRCGEPLFEGKPADVAAAMVDRQMTKGTLPVVVDVWAPWCGPCRMMAPEFEKAAQVGEPGMRFLKLNSDEHQEMAARFGIRGIPTMLLLRDGKEVARVSGAMTSNQILGWLAQNR
ncbi:thiol reductase thioredoxin [Youhaiella tibetensis]|uniref:Thioredoxin n=1 Tax=Paradevosia tibetensis TaxID=1447062 RepID=A0A5B9DKM1_9HYPH|nr:thioredoxin TrxC [Youhaiella tibetensis]AKR54578.1 Thioredoxin [Devosia sp. H5989]QEE19697.1 thioredoxin TrxC [Youhaiella tibetensis]GGF30776.1 thiol reductase thioredoxin [Youhaiella tibetensis]